MADFHEAFKKTSLAEGGYANDSDDRGGETIFGISRVHWPDWPGWGHVDELKNYPGFPQTAEQDRGLWKLALSFYKERFWDALKGDSIESQDIAEELYDAHVNTGRGVEFLQRALNELALRTIGCQRLKVDNVMGPNTLDALHAYIESAWYREKRLVQEMDFLQHLYYRDLAYRNPSQFKFYEGGWVTQRTT